MNSISCKLSSLSSHSEKTQENCGILQEYFRLKVSFVLLEIVKFVFQRETSDLPAKMSQERTSSHVVHVRENSASDLEALFDPHAAEAKKSIPLRDRNLPASFFQQPGLNQMGHGKNGPEVPGYNEVGPISHIRAHSSPASLQQTLSAAPQPPPPSQHLRQHSCDMV